MSLPALQNVTVAVNRDSVKVAYNAYPGACDYRIYEQSNPLTVKYAGCDQNTAGNPPLLEVEWNGLAPGVPTVLIVEAVDAVGPVPPCTLTDANNSAMYPDTASPTAGADMTCILGSNSCDTNDGKTSTNGQGPVGNSPNAIAQSLPFTVTATGGATLPSGPDATQVIYDDFLGDDTAASPIGAITTISADGGTDTARYDMKTAKVDWDIICYNIDATNTKAFIMDNHFMDCLFDGGTPGSNNPLHVGHGVLSLSPKQTVDFSGGQILHVMMEVDATFAADGRRWCAFNIAPADDLITNFEFGFNNSSEINNSNNALFVQFNPNTIVDLYGKDSSGNATDNRIVGAPGQAPNYGYRAGNGNGRGLDNRSRFDLFVSQTHFQVYEDGVKICDYDIPGGLPFSAAKVYFSHYLYHSALFDQEAAEYAPSEVYWLTYRPFADERHWDNLAAEVLPAATAWASLASRIVMPVPVPATYVSGTVAPPPPPLLTETNIAVSGITSASATITWTTDNAATGSVNYGTDIPYTSTTNETDEGATSHSVTLTGLLADTIYHFAVTGTDTNNSSATSPDATFQTLAETTEDITLANLQAQVTTLSVQLATSTAQVAKLQTYVNAVDTYLGTLYAWVVANVTPK